MTRQAVVGATGVTARSVHQPNGFFITSEGYEYVLNLGRAARPRRGRWSIDHALGLDRSSAGARVPRWQ
jgi:putative oxidoreductase